MPLPVINLDDRTFEQLFDDLRRRIAVYVPEWTDHNESDPGIALLQLFCWLQEMTFYRMNRVPDKMFIEFLRLVGIELTAPAPAHADLTFALNVKDLPTAVAIPKGTQVTLAGGSSGSNSGPIIFETDDNLFAVGAQILAVQVYDAARFQLFRVQNFSFGDAIQALSNGPQTGCAFAVGFDSVFPPGRYSMLVRVVDTATPFVQARGSGIDSYTPPVNALWEYSTGDPLNWSPLSVAQDDTRSLTKTGYLQFDAPTDGDTLQYGLWNDPAQPLFWLRYRIVSVLGGGYETPPQVSSVLINTISATNAVTETLEVLGYSTGLPNQSFTLAHSPVLAMPAGVTGRVQVQEEESGSYVTWTEVPNFDSSLRTDTHYTLDSSTGLVQFGDGKNGKIPRALTSGSVNQTSFERNIRATEYRWGGGAAGIAGANKITSLNSPVPYVSTVTNVAPSYGGSDEESLDDAKARAPMVIRTMTRAVTADDFAFLAEGTPGANIRRAVAYPLLNPNYRIKRPISGGLPAPEVPIPGVVTVIVVPDSTDLMPTPSSATLGLVADWLDQHRLLTAELYVAAPRYRLVHIRARVIADPSADSGVVQQQLTAALLAYFHPLTGGPKGQGWDFGGTIDFSGTYRQILSVPGVQRIDTSSVATFVDDELVPACTDYPLEPDELVYSIDHELEVTYS